MRRRIGQAIGNKTFWFLVLAVWLSFDRLLLGPQGQSIDWLPYLSNFSLHMTAAAGYWEYGPHYWYPYRMGGVDLLASGFRFASMDFESALFHVFPPWLVGRVGYFITLWLGGLLTYVLCRRTLKGSAGGSIFAGIFFAFSLSNHPESIGLGVLPFAAFFCLEGVRGRDWKLVVLGSLVLAFGCDFFPGVCLALVMGALGWVIVGQFSALVRIFGGATFCLIGKSALGWAATFHVNVNFNELFGPLKGPSFEEWWEAALFWGTDQGAWDYLLVCLLGAMVLMALCFRRSRNYYGVLALALVLPLASSVCLEFNGFLLEPWRGIVSQSVEYILPGMHLIWSLLLGLSITAWGSSRWASFSVHALVSVVLLFVLGWSRGDLIEEVWGKRQQRVWSELEPALQAAGIEHLADLGDPKEPHRALALGMPSEVLEGLGLEMVYGSSTGAPKHSLDIQSLLSRGGEVARDFHLPLLRFLNTRYVIAPYPIDGMSGALVEIPEFSAHDPIKVYELQGFYPRFYMLSSATEVKTQGDLLGRMLNLRSRELQSTVFLDTDTFRAVTPFLGK